MGAFLKKILDEAKGKSFEEAGNPGEPNSSSGIVNRISLISLFDYYLVGGVTGGNHH